ncbi:MAG: hypothetical protein K0R09_508 [Clostridiales bacterium]|nr:hypothetical protein [Clostridiales bacterium]
MRSDKLKQLVTPHLLSNDCVILFLPPLILSQLLPYLHQIMQRSFQNEMHSPISTTTES